MIYVSTFLLYASPDAPFVEAVACELGRRGIIPWFNTQELPSSTSLREALEIAIRQQATVTLFLSSAALGSPWVKEELAIALALDDTPETRDCIIPVYLEDPVELISSNSLLREKWLHPDGKRVDRFGIAASQEDDPSVLAKTVADDIARWIYRILGIAAQKEIVLFLDQRGEGVRHGTPRHIPEDILALDAPALVFRPTPGARSPGETMYGEVWTSTWTAMKWALTEALEGVRWAHFKTIHLLGASQLAFPFFLGQYFNRNTSANLFCTNIDGHTFTNQGQPRHGPLEKGNPHCDMPHPEVPPLPEQGQFNSISLLLSKPYLVTPVCQYLRDHGESPPLVWVKHEHFDDNQQVMSYISDIVALLMHLNTKYGVRTIYLFCGLPFHVVPLLAANLLHVVEEVTFMEYRRDLQGTEMPPGEMYVALQTKTRGEVS